MGAAGSATCALISEVRSSLAFLDQDFGEVVCRGECSDEYVCSDAVGVAVCNRRHPGSRRAVWKKLRQ